MPTPVTSPTEPAPSVPAAKFDPMPPPVPPASPACANCGEPLQGPYCAQCGQHIADYHRSVWRFFTDFLDNTFCWDSKVLRTLEPLLRQPGFLTREFMDGRRVRYVHPLRLFLFISAVSLAVTGFISHHRSHSGSHAKTHHPASTAKAANPARRSHQSDPEDRDDESSDPAANAAVPVVAPGAAATPTPSPLAGGSIGQTVQQLLAASAAASPSVKPLVGVSTPVSAQQTPTPPRPAAPAGQPEKSALEAQVNRIVENAMTAAEEASKQAKKNAKDGTADLTDLKEVGRRFDNLKQGADQRLSWVALALLPVFALLLRTVYWREDHYYFAHLVFSLHYHAFLLLFWMAYAVAGAVAAVLPLSGLWDFLLSVCFFLPGWYLFVALRRFYGEGSVRTLVKVLVLGSLHLLVIFIGVESVGAGSMFSGN